MLCWRLCACESFYRQAFIFCRSLIYKIKYLYHNLFMETFSCTFFIIKKSFRCFFFFCNVIASIFTDYFLCNKAANGDYLVPTEEMNG